jgi:5-methylcytosine-specific restriction endonuclease McrA
MSHDASQLVVDHGRQLPQRRHHAGGADRPRQATSTDLTRRGPQTGRSVSSSTGYGAAWRRLRLGILARDRYVCAYCGAPANSVDHVVPRAAGGTDRPTNLVACCTSCNSARAAHQTAQSKRTAARPGRLVPATRRTQTGGRAAHNASRVPTRSTTRAPADSLGGGTTQEGDSRKRPDSGLFGGVGALSVPASSSGSGSVGSGRDGS